MVCGSANRGKAISNTLLIFQTLTVIVAARDLELIEP